MPICSRCGRAHRGICGIPVGVTPGFGASRSQSATTPKVQRYQKVRVTHPVVLESLLERAKSWKSKVDKLLKDLPPDSSECEELLDRESKLGELINQLVNQIAVLGRR